jgi:phosphoglycolate phosphatase
MGQETKVQAVLFDYDGTLRDSFTQVYQGACMVLAELGLPTHTFEEFRTAFTIPSDPYWRERGATLPVSDIMQKWCTYATIDETPLFPDSIPTLIQLKEKGILTALISGHTHDNVVQHTEEHGIAQYLDHIEGGVSIKDRAMHGFLKRVGVPKERACYVGDSTSDMRDACKAGVTGIGITRGADSTGVLRSAGATHVIAELSELLAFEF